MAVDVGALQRQHPEWNIVDAIAAPGGGVWALGRDGGVFALDANGNPSASTPFFGAYTQLAPEQRQGDRYFVSIQADPATGGYTLVSNRVGQTYRFAGNQQINQEVNPATTPAPTETTDFSNADLNQLTAALNSLGLGDLINQAWTYYKDPHGAAGDQQAVLNWLPTTNAYKEHFPGLTELQQQGRAWTPAQWNTYYNNAQDLATQWGLPPGYLDRNDIGTLLTHGVSADELGQRIQAAGNAIYNADPAVIQQMRDYGLTDGDLTAFFLDPDKATPFVEKKAEMQRGQIGAAARTTGYGNIDYATAEQLQKMGVSADQAQQGFGRLAGQHALFANTAEESMIGEDITQQEQLGAQFGDNAANQQEIEGRRARRQAAFQGGGGAATGGGGRTGIG